MSVKVKSPCLLDISTPCLFKEVLETSFKQGLDYEVVDVQKTIGESYAFVKTTTPVIVKKIFAKYLIVHNEMLHARGGF